MAKKIAWSIIGGWICLAMPLQAVTLIDENFDADTVGGTPSASLALAQGTTVLSVVDSASVPADPFGGAGNRSFYLEDQDATKTAQIGWAVDSFEGQTNGMTFTFKMYAVSNAVVNDPFQIVRLGENNAPNSTLNSLEAAVDFYVFSTNFQANTGTGGGLVTFDQVPGVDFAFNTVWDFELDIAPSNDTYSISINGTQLTTGNGATNRFGFRNAKDINFVSFIGYSANAGTRVFYDDVLLEDDTVPQTNPPPAIVETLVDVDFESDTVGQDPANHGYKVEKSDTDIRVVGSGSVPADPFGGDNQSLLMEDTGSNAPDIGWPTAGFVNETRDMVLMASVYMTKDATWDNSYLSITAGKNNLETGSTLNTLEMATQLILLEDRIQVRSGASTLTIDQSFDWNTVWDVIVYISPSNRTWSASINGTTLSDNGVSTFDFRNDVDGINYVALTGGTSVADAQRFFADNILLGVLAEPDPEVRILGIEAVSSSVVKLEIGSNAPGRVHPEATAGLVNPAWGAVGHSTNGLPPFIETNLSYSAAAGSNFVIYVEADSDAEFFKMVVE